MTPQKFALQLYSRLTNANPELVLVFMQAGGSGKQVPINRSMHPMRMAGIPDADGWRCHIFVRQLRSQPLLRDGLSTRLRPSRCGCDRSPAPP